NRPISMLMRPHHLGWIVLMSCTVWLQAETNNLAVRPISLKECIRLALEHNLDLQIERYNPQIAGFNLTGGYCYYEPQFKIAARHNYLDQPTELDPKKPNPDFGYEMSTDSFEPSLSGRLPTGLTYDLGASFADSNVRTDFSFSPHDAAEFPPFGIRNTNEFLGFAGIKLRQPLLKDFWIDAYRQPLSVIKKTLQISQ